MNMNTLFNPLLIVSVLLSSACVEDKKEEEILIIDITTSLNDSSKEVVGVTSFFELGALPGAQKSAFITHNANDDSGALLLHGSVDAEPVRIESDFGGVLNPHLVKSYDVDGDGDLELVMLEYRRDRPVEEKLEAPFVQTLLVFDDPFGAEGVLTAEQGRRISMNTVNLKDFVVTDIDGDGTLDILILKTSDIEIYHDGFNQEGFLDPTATMTASEKLLSYSGKDLVLGDFNGDGQTDVAAAWTSSSEDSTDAGVWFYFGPIASETELLGAEQASALWRGASDNLGLGERLIGVGDLDKDGRDDLVVSAVNYDDTHPGRVFLVSGAPVGDAIQDVRDGALATFEGAVDGDRIGFSIAAGDRNGDGVMDLVMNSNRNDREAFLGDPVSPRPIYVMHGPFEGTRGVLDADEVILESSATDYVTQMAMADVTGSGRDELLICASNARDVGVLHIFE